MVRIPSWKPTRCRPRKCPSPCPCCRCGTGTSKLAIGQKAAPATFRSCHGARPGRTRCRSAKADSRPAPRQAQRQTQAEAGRAPAHQLINSQLRHLEIVRHPLRRVGKIPAQAEIFLRRRRCAPASCRCRCAATTRRPPSRHRGSEYRPSSAQRPVWIWSTALPLMQVRYSPRQLPSGRMRSIYMAALSCGWPWPNQVPTI